VYYVNHVDKTTSWTPPSGGAAASGLRFAYSQDFDRNGLLFYLGTADGKPGQERARPGTLSHPQRRAHI
jgi:hypothetical protein